MKYDSCTIYVRWSGDDSSLAESVADALKGEPGRFASVQSQMVSADVQKNHAYDPTGRFGPNRTDQRPQFLSWPFYVDIERNPQTSPSEMVEAISAVLDALWHGDIDAVASCDFEDELPRRGGYPG